MKEHLETRRKTNNITQDFVVLLEFAVLRATFDLKRFGSVSGQQLGQMYRTYRGDNRLYLRLAELRLDEDLLRVLTKSLRCLLSDYIENDRIGNGLVNFLGGITEPSVLDYTRDLVRVAAILGPERLGQLLYGWAKGEPIRYGVSAVLSGLSVDEPLVMGRGIRLSKLPESSDALKDELPPLVDMQFGIMNMAGATKVTLDCQGSPIFYKAGTRTFQDFQTTWKYGHLEQSSLDALCDALSLANNSCVRLVIAWSDFGELDVLGAGSGFSIYRASDRTSGGPRMSCAHIAKAKDLLVKRLDDHLSDKKLDLAISRWMSSKRGGRVADQFIDLRIALEALYLPNGEGELSFRLAIRGAWHLGRNYEERLECQKTLRDAYNTASKAIHATTKPYTPEDEKLLRAAQDLCRKGILKRLDECGTPDWNGLILGKDI